MIMAEKMQQPMNNEFREPKMKRALCLERLPASGVYGDKDIPEFRRLAGKVVAVIGNGKGQDVGRSVDVSISIVEISHGVIVEQDQAEHLVGTVQQLKQPLSPVQQNLSVDSSFGGRILINYMKGHGEVEENGYQVKLRRTRGTSLVFLFLYFCIRGPVPILCLYYARKHGLSSEPVDGGQRLI